MIDSSTTWLCIVGLPSQDNKGSAFNMIVWCLVSKSTIFGFFCIILVVELSMENVEYDYSFKVLVSKTSVTDESCAFQQKKPETRHHDLLFEF